jgi:hypothetical protein
MWTIMCAKHQPQHGERPCGIKHFSADWFGEAAAAGPALRDTAALRGQCADAPTVLEQTKLFCADWAED